VAVRTLVGEPSDRRHQRSSKAPASIAGFNSRAVRMARSSASPSWAVAEKRVAACVDLGGVGPPRSGALAGRGGGWSIGVGRWVVGWVPRGLGDGLGVDEGEGVGGGRPHAPRVVSKYPDAPQMVLRPLGFFPPFFAPSRTRGALPSGGGSRKRRAV
jgi:hypothetical protein